MEAGAQQKAKICWQRRRPKEAPAGLQIWAFASAAAKKAR